MATHSYGQRMRVFRAIALLFGALQVYGGYLAVRHYFGVRAEYERRAVERVERPRPPQSYREAPLVGWVGVVYLGGGAYFVAVGLWPKQLIVPMLERENPRTPFTTWLIPPPSPS